MCTFHGSEAALDQGFRAGASARQAKAKNIAYFDAPAA
jgi:hypothetical protein